jgi:YYY domain-containing protein
MESYGFSTIGIQAVAAFIAWWGIIQFLGLLALPLCVRVFAWLPDRGYTASKAVGLMLASYLVWLGASTGFLTNTPAGALTAALLVGVISFLVRFWLSSADSRQPIIPFLLHNRRLVITAELLFFLAFASWTVLRAYAPDKIMSAGGEKWMEIAFLNGVLNSPSFPPQDPWLSGFAISYYYFGYVMMGFMTLLSQVPATVGFELHDALLFAMAALGSYGIVYNLIQSTRTKPAHPAHLFALLGPFLLLIMSNLEGVLESLHSAGYLPAGLTTWLDIPDLANAPVKYDFNPGVSNGWWWWRASRVIQDYNLLGNPHESPITEFPFFSFLLGDNHPHVLGLPFVLLAIVFALGLFLRAQRSISPSAAPEMGDQKVQTSLNPLHVLNGDWLLFVFGGFLYGGLAFLNTWDFPIYLGLGAVAHLAGRRFAGESLSTAIKPTIVLAVGWLIAAVGFYFMFYLSFSSQAGGILPYIFPPTRLPQYFVMFAAFVLITGGFLIILLLENSVLLRRSALRGWAWMAALGVFLALLVVLLVGMAPFVARIMGVDPALLSIALGDLSAGDAARQILIDRLSDPWLFILLSALVGLGFGAVFLSSSSLSNLSSPIPFVLLLIILGFGLTWIPEFFYLRDNFSVRMNTVFKFYFQGWVMLSVASAYALWWLSTSASSTMRVLRTVLVSTAIIVIGLGLVYPLLAIQARTASDFAPNLDGASTLARFYPDDWALIAWLQANGRETGQAAPVILEAPGLSYNYEGRVSAFTGFPTVLGWYLHEGQWRGDYTEQDKRRPDIEAIYTSTDPDLTLLLLDKWQVRFVVLSNSERSYVQEICSQAGRACNPVTTTRKFEQILTPVFIQGSATLYAVP